MVPPPEGNRAQESSEPPPYGILAAAAVIVAISAAVPIGLLVSSRNTPPPQAVKEPDAAGSARVDARSSGPTSATATSPPPLPASPSASAAVAAAPDADDAGATTAKSGDKADAAAEASAEPTGPGWLSIATAPLPARVTEKGRVLCTTTPCAKLALSPGEHVLILENKEESLRKKLVVTITSGETIARRVTMKAAAPVP